MYSTYNEGSSVFAERFMKNLKGKIYNKLTANNCRSYLGCLNKLIGEYKNTYHRSIGKKPIDADYSALNEEIETNPKAPKFKIGNRVRIFMYRNIFNESCTKNRSREMFVIVSVLKTNPWIHKIKDLNGEKITGSYEKELLVSKL